MKALQGTILVVTVFLVAQATTALAGLQPDWRYAAPEAGSDLRSGGAIPTFATFTANGTLRVFMGSASETGSNPTRISVFYPGSRLPDEVIEFVPVADPPAGRTWQPLSVFPWGWGNVGYYDTGKPFSERYSLLWVFNETKAGYETISDSRAILFDWEERDFVNVEQTFGTPNYLYLEQVHLAIIVSNLIEPRVNLTGIDGQTGKVVWEHQVKMVVPGGYSDAPRFWKRLVPLGTENAVFYGLAPYTAPPTPPKYTIVGRTGVVREINNTFSTVSMDYDPVGHRLAAIELRTLPGAPTGTVSLTLYDEQLVVQSETVLSKGDKNAVFVDNGKFLLLTGGEGISSYRVDDGVPVLHSWNRSASSAHWLPPLPSPTKPFAFIPVSQEMVWWDVEKNEEVGRVDVYTPRSGFDPTNGFVAANGKENLTVYSNNASGDLPPLIGDFPCVPPDDLVPDGSQWILDTNTRTVQMPPVPAPDRAVIVEKVGKAFSYPIAEPPVPGPFKVSTPALQFGIGAVQLETHGLEPDSIAYTVGVMTDGENLQWRDCIIHWNAGPPSKGSSFLSGIVVLVALWFAAAQRLRRGSR